jgi:hypothetical protein
MNFFDYSTRLATFPAASGLCCSCWALKRGRCGSLEREASEVGFMALIVGEDASSRSGVPSAPLSWLRED